METTQPAGGISGNVLFYSSPEPLNREQHAKLGPGPQGQALRLRPEAARPCRWPSPNSRPAALSYPVIFAGDDRVPLAVMGLNTGENLYIAGRRRLRARAYIPAYIRRYPFVLANDESQDRLIVCIDRSSDLLAEGGQTPLFDDKGEPTEYTQNCIKFCDDFEVERRRTDSFVQLLKDNDLFELKKAIFTPLNAERLRPASRRPWPSTSASRKRS